MKRLLSLLLAAALLLGIGAAAAAAESGMQWSKELISYLEREEGFSAQPYNDGTGWYIGYGAACVPTEWPDGITKEEAEEQLVELLDLHSADVNFFLSRYGITVSQSQYDAMCAMTYNFGANWMNPANRLPAYLIDGLQNYTEQEIASAFATWSHFEGEVHGGLLRRRIAEVNLFLYGDYSFSYSGWSWLLTDAGEGEQESDVYLYRTGGHYLTLPSATLDGQWLAGWRKPDGTMLYADDLVDGNLSVTAVWTDTPPADAAADGAESALRPADPEQADDEPLFPFIEEEPLVIRKFPDVSPNAWYASYVHTLTDQGILNGYEDGTFRPGSSVTWGEALKLILRAAGFPEQRAQEGAHWASGFRSFAVGRQYIAYGAVNDLNAVITRDEVAALTASALELSGAEDAANPFADTSSEEVLALYQAGIVEGSEEDGLRLFKGGDSITRAEISAILVRMTDYVEDNFVFVSGQRATINPALRGNSYDSELFQPDAGGRVRYLGDDQTVLYGIDVSYYQGDIDWEKVAADGIDFAIIRCGFRGYGSEGRMHVDDAFYTNIKGAQAAGLDVGVYFFSQAVTLAEAREEAAMTLELIRGYDIRYPVVFDWEQITASGSRTASPNWKMVSDCITVFCDEIAAHGYTPMAYFNKAMSYLRLDMEQVQAYDGWLAWYHNYMDYLYDFQMWQYSSTGRVDGIEGNVDMNICLKRYA